MKKSEYSSPTAHAKLVGKTFRQFCHSFKMLFITLYVPTILPVLVYMGYYCWCSDLVFHSIRFSSSLYAYKDRKTILYQQIFRIKTSHAFFCPVAAVEVAVAHGFGDVLLLHLGAGGKVGNGACHLEDAAVGTG